MMKKLLLTSSTKQEAKNAKRPHGTFIMLLLFALLLNSQNSFSQIYDFNTTVEGFDDNINVARLDVTWTSDGADGGYLNCTTKGVNDPSVTNLDADFSTTGLDQLNFRVKNGTASANVAVFLYFDNNGVTDKFVYVKSTTKESVVFEEKSITLTGKTSTNGVTYGDGLMITKVRIDPNANGSVGTVLFDYIRFQDSSGLSSSNTQVSEVQTALYPNPVKQGQDVNIQLANINKQQYKNIAVYDLQGRAVMNRTLDSNESPKLSTSQLTKGLYFVHLGGEDSSEVFKLIVD